MGLGPIFGDRSSKRTGGTGLSAASTPGCGATVLRLRPFPWSRTERGRSSSKPAWLSANNDPEKGSSHYRRRGIGSGNPLVTDASGKRRFQALAFFPSGGRSFLESPPKAKSSRASVSGISADARARRPTAYKRDAACNGCRLSPIVFLTRPTPTFPGQRHGNGRPARSDFPSRKPGERRRAYRWPYIGPAKTQAFQFAGPLMLKSTRLNSRYQNIDSALSAESVSSLVYCRTS